MRGEMAPGHSQAWLAVIQFLAIGVTLGQCLPPLSLGFTVESNGQVVRKLPALTPSWLLQNKEALPDAVS